MMGNAHPTGVLEYPHADRRPLSLSRGLRMIPTPEQMQNQRDFSAGIMAGIPYELGAEIDRARDMIFIAPTPIPGITPEWERAMVAIFVQLRAKALADNIPPAKVYGFIETLIGPQIEAMLRTEN